MMNRRGEAHIMVVGTLASFVTSAVGAILQSANGGGLAPMLGAMGIVVAIYGFLLLAYRDLLQKQAELKGEPEDRKEAVAQLREDLDRMFGEVYRRLDGLEERERERLERSER